MQILIQDKMWAHPTYWPIDVLSKLQLDEDEMKEESLQDQKKFLTSLTVASSK